jgi:hypothetical protein
VRGRKLLRDYLKDTGRRQADLIREGGFDDGLFSRWLSGERVPPLRHAVKLARLTQGRVPVDAWV